MLARFRHVSHASMLRNNGLCSRTEKEKQPKTARRQRTFRPNLSAGKPAKSDPTIAPRRRVLTTVPCRVGGRARQYWAERSRGSSAGGRAGGARLHFRAQPEVIAHERQRVIDRGRVVAEQQAGESRQEGQRKDEGAREADLRLL